MSRIVLAALFAFFFVATFAASDSLDIVGKYHCPLNEGQCAQADSSTFNVTADMAITRVPGTDSLYSVGVTVNGTSFYETEIGVLSVTGVLRTSTANISNQVYPVLEEYDFFNKERMTTGNQGWRANSFQKTIRRPFPGAFKSCTITCHRTD